MFLKLLQFLTCPFLKHELCRTGSRDLASDTGCLLWKIFLIHKREKSALDKTIQEKCRVARRCGPICPEPALEVALNLATLCRNTVYVITHEGTGFTCTQLECFRFHFIWAQPLPLAIMNSSSITTVPSQALMSLKYVNANARTPWSVGWYEHIEDFSLWVYLRVCLHAVRSAKHNH